MHRDDGSRGLAPVAGGLVRVFDGSTLAGLADGELLARFVARRDEAAFEGLVARLGPMVLGVCRRMLLDRADADDAFQATFLVLVRRARDVGRGDLVGPWLHGVAVRVCRQARARAARRRGRERTGVVVEACPPASTATAATLFDRAEVRATIDAEIARLPLAERRLIVLCDVEGLSRLEAADRLGWTPNMVRGRLARARARLRGRLVRLGCTPDALAEPARIPLPWLIPAPREFLAASARVALASLPSPSLGLAPLATAPALSLARGVLRTMTLTSWKTLAAGALTATTLAAGTAGAIRAQGPGPDPAPAQQPADPPPVVTSFFDPDQARQVAASPPPSARALDLVRPDLAFYLANKQAFPDLIETFAALQNSENEFRARREPPTPAERREDATAHVARLRDFQRALQAAPAGDPLTAKRQELVRLAIEHAEHPEAGGRPDLAPVDLKALRVERLRAARTRQQAQQNFYEEGRITIDRLIAADRQVMLAEQAIATTPADRRAALETYLDRLRQIQDTELIELEIGRATAADIAEAADALLEARLMLAQEARPALAPADAGKPVPPPRVDLDRRMTELERKVDQILGILSTSPGKR